MAERTLWFATLPNRSTLCSLEEMFHVIFPVWTSPEAVAALSWRKPSVQGYSYLLNKCNCKMPFLNLREVLEAGHRAQMMSGKSGGGKEGEKSTLMPADPFLSFQKALRSPGGC